MPTVPGISLREPETAPRLSDFDTPFGEYVEAVGGDIAQFSTPAAMGRLKELIGAEFGEEGDDYNPRAFMLTGDPRFVQRAAPATDVLDAAAAKERIKGAGLDGHLSVPETGMRQGVLDILIDRKHRELRRAEARAAAPGSYAWAGVPLEILGGIADPLNVASSFIPVVGEARWASMLAKTAGRPMARAAGRVALGAADAAVGAAAIEPLTQAFQSSEQADYGLMDSLLNVTFGTALGGGLHVVSGAVGDALARRATAKPGTPPPPRTASEMVSELPPEVRESLHRTAMAQVAEGRPVEIDAMARPYVEAYEQRIALMEQAQDAPTRQELRDAEKELYELEQRMKQEPPSYERLRQSILDNAEAADVLLHGETAARGKALRRIREKAAAEQAKREFESAAMETSQLADRWTRQRAEVERMTAANDALTRLRAFERQEKRPPTPEVQRAVAEAIDANDKLSALDSNEPRAEPEPPPPFDTRDERIAAAEKTLADETAKLTQMVRHADAGQEEPRAQEFVKAELEDSDADGVLREKYTKAAQAAAACLLRGT